LFGVFVLKLRAVLRPTTEFIINWVLLLLLTYMKFVFLQDITCTYVAVFAVCFERAWLDA